VNNPQNKILVLTPRRRISLWDMIQFFAGDFALLQSLKSTKHTLTVLKEVNPADIPDEKKRTQLVDILTKLSSLWVKIDLIGEVEMIQNVIHHLENAPYKNYSEVTEAIGMIISKTQTELEVRSFAYIPFDKDQYFEGDKLFGDDVKRACSEEINAHIKDSGNCLAADLNTAAVFHLMLVAEFGMRALATQLKVKIKNTPTKEAGWAKLIEGIKKKIEIRTAKNEKKQSKKEREFLKFCRLANEQIFFFKEIWRDNTMHAQVRFNESEALGVFERVKKLMQLLAKRISLK